MFYTPKSLLKPCPFCGSDSVLETGFDKGNGNAGSGGWWASIECSRCEIGFQTFECSIESQAAEAVVRRWNRRDAQCPN